MPIDKPFSQACENNKAPILAVLKEHLTAPPESLSQPIPHKAPQPIKLLEVGSGTGQHAAWLAPQLPHVQWQPSDVRDNLAGVRQWLDEAQLGEAQLEAQLSNVLDPIELDVRNHWPSGPYQAIFTANTLHIMSQQSAALCIARGAKVLADDGVFMIYGPFNYDGHFTSSSNAQFQQWLQARNPESGIRDFEWIAETMAANGLSLRKDHEMPANNRLLVFQRTQS